MRWMTLCIALALFGCDDDATETTDGASPTPDAAADVDPPGDLDPVADARADMGPAPDAAPMPDAGPPPAAPLGYRAEEITYTPVGADEPRTLPVFWWYPTDVAEGELVLYRPFVAERVYGGAPPAIEGTAPLMVFSHGRSGFGQYSYFLAEHFARRGFVVMALDHVGDTLTDAVDSPEIYRYRPQDITAVIDHALAPGDGHPLAGTVGGPVVVTGHSFGGYTSLAVGGADYDVETFAETCPASDSPFCGGYNAVPDQYAAGFADDRVELLIPMAPGNFDLFGPGLAAIDLPVLLITGNRDASTDDAGSGDPIWAGLPDDARHRRVRFVEGGHFTFTDICPITGGLGRDNGCGPDFTPVEVAHPIVTAYVDAFVDRHLFGGATVEGDALIDGETTLHPDVVLVRKEAP